MTSTKPEEKRDCYYATDPRANPGLATALAGQNVLVTGAGRVGRAIAVFLRILASGRIPRRKRGCIVYTASNGAHTNLGIMGSYALGKLGLVSLAEIVHHKSAQTAYDILHKLAAGLVTALAAGKLDFLSGRFIDANVDIEEYIKRRL
ncbi:hypothetical protein VTN00DRAFT_2160 [Thermoascus crustaceus]|uniref:uncharacterized protein n=1 Tax=Thermoascus crustaceus TaxID=5088 RepID=UPI003744852A